MKQLTFRRGVRLRVNAALVVALALAATFAGASPAFAATTVPLGTLDGYNVLAATTVTNTGATIVNDGDVGLSPGSAVVGFPPGIINNGVKHVADAQALQAKHDWTTAYGAANGQQPPTQTGIIDLAGLTLPAGIYDGDAISNSGTLTLSGDSSSVFIFRAASTLTIENGSTIAFSGGATQCNVFWTVASSATIGTTAVFAGTLLARGSISAATGATIGGRLLASTGAVTLQGNTINRDVADCGARPAIVPSSPVVRATRPPAGSGLALTGVDPLPAGIPALMALTVGAAFVIYTARRKRSAGRVSSK
ncbi:MAG: Sortase [Glaciihabitans sp.]|nr:Sortase [Glaciihabitans sp.]